MSVLYPFPSIHFFVVLYEWRCTLCIPRAGLLLQPLWQVAFLRHTVHEEHFSHPCCPRLFLSGGTRLWMFITLFIFTLKNSCYLKKKKSTTKIDGKTTCHHCAHRCLVPSYLKIRVCGAPLVKALLPAVLARYSSLVRFYGCGQLECLHFTTEEERQNNENCGCSHYIK